MPNIEKIFRLTPEKEDEACNLASDGAMYKDIAKLLGFKSKQQFDWYQRKFPEFQKALSQSRDSYCDYLEDQLLEIPLQYDPDVAKQLSANIMKVLQYRNPKRYGDKVNVDMNVSVDISGALDRAERRVLDITNTNVLQLSKNKDDT